MEAIKKHGGLSFYGLLFALFVGADTSQVPFPVYRIKEVQFSGGVAGASSIYSNDWLPDNAFKVQQPTEIGWHIGNAAKEAHNLPLSIWYDFKSEGIRPAEVSFQPSQKTRIDKAPSSYQFVGSNDAVCNDAATWTVLCEDTSDRPWRSAWEVRYCKVKPEMTEKFRCLGIRVLNNLRKDGWTALRNIRMWERIESDVGDRKREL